MRVKPEDRMEVFGTLAVKHRGKPTALVALGPLLGAQRRQPLRPAARGGGAPRRGPRRAGGGRLRGRARGGGEALRRRVPQGRRLHRRHRRAGGRAHRRAPARAGHHDRGAPHGAARSPRRRPAKRLRVLLVDDSPIARATESALVQGAGPHRGRGPGRRGGLPQGPVRRRTTSSSPTCRCRSWTASRSPGGSRRTRGCRACRSSSSRRSPRRRTSGAGLDAGADAYLVKGELGVESLAQAIDRLT